MCYFHVKHNVRKHRLIINKKDYEHVDSISNIHISIAGVECKIIAKNLKISLKKPIQNF